MGGSSAKPADLDLKKSKDKLKKKRKQLTLILEVYLWRLKACFDAWGFTKYGVLETTDWIDRIEAKAKEYGKIADLDPYWIIRTAGRGLIQSLKKQSFKGFEKHYKSLEYAIKQMVKREEYEG